MKSSAEKSHNGYPGIPCWDLLSSCCRGKLYVRCMGLQHIRGVASNALWNRLGKAILRHHLSPSAWLEKQRVRSIHNA